MYLSALWLVACGFQEGTASLTKDVRPARDGNIAILQELCTARAKGTLTAYDLFIARHPDHRLAEAAKIERKALAGKDLSSRHNPECDGLIKPPPAR
jgi:hypothetical protein